MANRSVSQSPVLRTTDMFPNIDAARRDPEQSEILNVSHEHAFPLQHCILLDGREMYAVQDWIEGVAKPSDARVFWQQMKKRLKKTQPELYTACIQLPYLASNGKTYQMDFADGQTLYGITQHMGVDTGIRNQVLTHLAKTGAFIDAARRDPEQAERAISSYRRSKAVASGKPDEWITARELSVEARKQFTAALATRTPELNIGEATNLTYKNMIGMDAATLRRHLGIGQKDNPRDSMSIVLLSYITTFEASVSTLLEGYADNDRVHPDTTRRVITTVAQLTGRQAHETAALIGIDLVSGKRLLERGQ